MTFIIQALGFAGLALNVLCFQQKKQKTMLLLQFFANILFTVHYLLLGATTGFFTSIIGIFRGYIFSQKEHAWAGKRIWLYIFIFAYILVYPLVFLVVKLSFTTENAIIELIPIIGMVLSTIGFYMKKASQSRKVCLFSSPLWMVYNFVSGSASGFITDCFNMVSIVIGMIRLDRKEKSETN